MPGSRRKEPRRRAQKGGAKKCGASNGGSPTLRVSPSPAESPIGFSMISGRASQCILTRRTKTHLFFRGILEAHPAPPCV